MGIGGTEHPSGVSHHKKVVVIDDRLVFVAGIKLTGEDVADFIHALRHRLLAEKTRTVPRPNPVTGS